MKHGSLFAGIGGFDLGFERAGIETVWTVENDKNCNAVLEKHWPGVKRYGRIQEVGRHNLQPVDIVSGGFPCQDLSVAGRRAGLAGERSGLWFEFARVVEEVEPRWVVVENVPGLLSSNGGDDFAVVVGTLEQFGYCVAWRVLDSQHFGVPQRRRRVFVVGSLGDGSSVKILFESEGGEGNTAASRKEGEGTAGAFTPGPHGGYREGTGTLRRHGGDLGGGSEVLVAAPLKAASPSSRRGGSNPTAGEFVVEKTDGHAGKNIETTGYQGDVICPDDGKWVTLSAESGNLGGGGNALLWERAKAFTFADREHTCGAELEDTVGTLQAHPQSETSNIQKGVITYQIQTNDGGEHKRKDRPEGGMYVKETDKSLALGSSDRMVVFSQGNLRRPAGAEPSDDGKVPALRAEMGDHFPCIAFTERTRKEGRTVESQEGLAYALTNPGGGGRVHSRQIAYIRNVQNTDADIAPTLRDQGAGSGSQLMVGVRRLTPTECERLQGFPDGWTGGLSDTARYRCLGNAVTVNVAEWLGHRLKGVHDAGHR